MRLGIIDRYLLSETFKTWLAVTVVLATVLLGNTFSRYLSDTAGGKFDKTLLLSIVGATSASYFTILLPISILLAVLLSLGRFYRDNEMTVINACGIGLAQLYRSFLLFAAALAVVTAWLSLYLAPYANAKASELRDEARFATNLAATESGRFRTLAGGHGALYAEQVSADESEMRNVFGWFRGKDADSTKVFWAERAFQRLDTATNEGDLLLVNGTRYEGTAGENAYHITRFRQHGLHLPVARGEDDLSRAAKTTLALIESESTADQAELQRRLSLPIMVVMLTLLAVPLARVSPRQGRYGRLVAGILCYIVYSNLLAAADTWVKLEKVPVWVGLWWVHGAALALIAGMYWVRPGWLGRRRREAMA